MSKLINRINSTVECRSGHTPDDYVDAAQWNLRRRGGRDTGVAANAMDMLADRLRLAGRTDEALVVAGNERRIQFQGPEHADTLRTELRVGILLAQLQRPEEAEIHLRHVMDGAGDSLHLDQSSGRPGLLWLASAISLQERYDEGSGNA